MKKYIWYSDTHLNSAFPWAKMSMYRAIEKEKADGIFLSGDISNGLLVRYDLEQLAKHIECPIYFVGGNHDYFWTGINKTKDRFRELCLKYSNLHWLTESPLIELDDEVALIGTEGWYDVSLGDPRYIKYTFDWFCTPEFFKLKNMEERFEKFKELASESVNIINKKLNEALDKDYKNIYLITHFPIFAEATTDLHSYFGKYWLGYNINNRLGEAVKEIMSNYKKRNLTVLSGHTHQRQFAQISRNITAFTSQASYWGVPKSDNRFFI